MVALVTFTIFAALLFAAFELVSRVILYSRERHIPTVREMLSRERMAYLSEGKDRFTLFEKLFPHPYLGHVQHDNPPAGLAPRTNGHDRVNKQGFSADTDFPYKPSAEDFVVLLTGGSTAERFGHKLANGPCYLEQFLNERFLPPNGKTRFTVLNAAMGGWKQPQQSILFLLYADVVDALVTLDGYNELQFIRMGMVAESLEFEYPWVRLRHGANDDQPFYLTRLRIIRWLFNLSFHTPVLNRSYLCYFAVRSFRNRLYESLQTKQVGSPTSIESIFSLSEEIGDSETFRLGVNRYLGYIEKMNAIAKARNIATAHFLQPCAAIGKALTAEEARSLTKHNYQNDYRILEAAFLTLSLQGIFASSLLDIFANTDETVYRDDVHMVQNESWESLGHLILAERMSELLAKAWSLSKTERRAA